MIEKVFEILASSPVITVICTTVIILFGIYILRDQIIEYVKKRYNLYTESEVDARVEEEITKFRENETK